MSQLVSGQKEAIAFKGMPLGKVLILIPLQLPPAPTTLISGCSGSTTGYGSTSSLASSTCFRTAASIRSLTGLGTGSAPSASGSPVLYLPPALAIEMIGAGSSTGST